VCQQIGQHHAATDLPVIMLTARNQVSDLLEGLASGANDYLTKPFSKSELLGRIETHLQLARATREVKDARDTLELKVHARTAQLRTAHDQLQDANVHLERANGQLGRANENMLAVLNQLTIGAVATDADGRIAFLSQAAEMRFGQRQEDVLGQPWDRLFPLPEEDRTKLQSLYDQPPGRQTKVSVHLHTRAGRRYWIEIEVLADPRDPRQRIFFLYDVSEVADLQRRLGERTNFHGLVGQSKAIRLVYQQIQDMAQVETTVLIEGETGTGKELAARAIHAASPRKDQPFVAVNCAGLTESLLTSQLFGHKRGAFTGAVSDQLGVFEAAHGGTLFLDEIGDMPLGVQTALRRALQEREITRLGETTPRRINVRLISATNRTLDEEVAAGRFRLDLLYRIRVMRLRLPPLRERQTDIPPLVSWFLGQLRTATGKPTPDLSQEALQVLLSYPWPGNVRELKSAIESALIRCQGPIIQAADLPPELGGPLTPQPPPGGLNPDERQRILEALQRTGGNRKAAARMLGIGRATLYRKLASLGLIDQENADSEVPANHTDSRENE
jgi:PAS domain S-box-containing protein